MSKMRTGVLLACLAVLASVAVADTVTTTVWFNVPSDVTFTVTLPGKGGVASGATADIEYNSTTPTLNKINCTVAESAGASQTDEIPCFNYSNTGNREINITLQFGTELPSGVTVKAGWNNTAWIATCTCTDLPGCGDDDCVEVDDSAAVTVATIAYAGYREVWMWADYADYGGGSSAQRELTHTSVAN
jgi:hypothetical protein